MSLILQRKSKGLEPILPTILSPGTVITNDETSDARHFFKVTPRLWNSRQVAQFCLFAYGLMNLAVSHMLFNRQAAHIINLQEHNIMYSRTINTSTVVALLFGVDGIIYVSCSVFVFSLYNALIERQIDPFRAVSHLLTIVAVVFAFAIELGAVSGSKFALLTVTFMSALVPLMNLATEHTMFYARALAHLNSRVAPKVELLLPFALSFFVALFVACAPIYYSTLNPANNIRQKYVHLAAATIIAYQLAFGLWVVKNKKSIYVRCSVFWAACSAVLKLALLNAV